MHTPIYTIYLIRLEGKAVYVGFTSQTLEKRWKGHLSAARKMSSSVLHKAIRKYGEVVFTIEPIYTGEDLNHTLTVMEPHFIIEHNTFIKNDGYNMTLGGEGGVGHAVSEETKRKISESMKGMPRSDDHRRNIAESQKGRIHSEESVRKTADAKRGVMASEETKRKMSKSHMGHAVSEETKRKISEAKKGNTFVKMTDETKRKISEAGKGRIHSDETKRKMSEAAFKRSRVV